MCTVSFLATNKNQFIFTSNRDEAPRRNATDLITEEINNKQVLYPRDTGANGTWIAISNSNQLVCILNGAFEKHKRNVPYRKSRGVMALDFFEFKDHQEFLELYDFQNIEAFTMIIVDSGRLLEFRWDEQQQHLHYLNTRENHIWSSSTLYSNEWRIKREEWFKEWFYNNTNPQQEDVLDFHKNAGVGNPEYDVIMNRSDIVRTISITSIVNDSKSIKLSYENLLDTAIQKKDLYISV